MWSKKFCKLGDSVYPIKSLGFIPVETNNFYLSIIFHNIEMQSSFWLNFLEDLLIIPLSLFSTLNIILNFPFLFIPISFHIQRAALFHFTLGLWLIIAIYQSGLWVILPQNTINHVQYLFYVLLHQSERVHY